MCKLQKIIYVYFTYKIEKGDYKHFSDILLDFGGRNLTKEVKKIGRVYPNLRIDANKKHTIESVFNQSCVIDGVTRIKGNVYEIEYST